MIIAGDVCGVQGDIPRCMAMKNIRCDENLWPDQQERHVHQESVFHGCHFVFLW